MEKSAWFQPKERKNEDLEFTTDTQLFTPTKNKNTHKQQQHKTNKTIPLTTVLFVENSKGGRYAAMIKENKRA